jgi:hypothetical protein
MGLISGQNWAEFHMPKRRFYFATFLLLSGCPSFAHYVPVIQRCTRDVTTLCAAGQLGADPLVECVEKHFQDFSEPCQAALTNIAAVREACRSGIGHQCSAFALGAGRVLLCVKRKFAALSEPCKDAIGRAAERNAATH